MTVRRFAVRSRRGAYVALVVLTLIWGSTIIFGERLDATEWAGIGLIAAGLVIVSLLAWTRARRGEGDSPPTPVIESA